MKDQLPKETQIITRDPDAIQSDNARICTASLGTFWRAWLQKPLAVGAVWPSSKVLAKLICSEVGANQGAILELGPGTGVFTQALLDKGINPATLFLVESAPEFVQTLRRQFPRVAVHEASALNLAALADIADQQFAAAISGLPLRAMADHDIESIISATFDRLQNGAKLFQFTYGWRNPVPQWIMAKYHLRAYKIGRVWRNLPPAAVYRIERAHAG